MTFAADYKRCRERILKGNRFVSDEGLQSIVERYQNAGELKRWFWVFTFRDHDMEAQVAEDILKERHRRYGSWTREKQNSPSSSE